LSKKREKDLLATIIVLKDKVACIGRCAVTYSFSTESHPPKKVVAKDAIPNFTKEVWHKDFTRPASYHEKVSGQSLMYQVPRNETPTP